MDFQPTWMDRLVSSRPRPIWKTSQSGSPSAAFRSLPKVSVVGSKDTIRPV